MSVITFVCAGQMNSAITFPAFENGHEVRLVGSPLDRDIIDGLRKDNFHITLKRTLHDGIKYYQIEELEEALEGADLILGGVSSFGLDWFCDEILPVLPEDVPSVVEAHAKEGVDFMTIHAGINRRSVEAFKRDKRMMNIVSRGGSLLFAWMEMTGNENPFFEYYDEILDICNE